MPSRHAHKGLSAKAGSGRETQKALASGVSPIRIGSKNTIQYFTVIFLIVFCFALFTYSLLQYIHKGRGVIETHTIPVRFTVGDIYGVELENDILTFGSYPPGGSVRRSILITNTYPFPITTEFLIREPLNTYLVAVQPEFILPEEIANIPVVLTVPMNASKGNYDGTLVIRIKKLPS